jgi:nitrate/nitrite-specific signal transduction histidine kinase
VSGDGSARGEELLALSRRGARLAQQLLDENASLRERIGALESQSGCEDQSRRLAERIAQLEAENDGLASLYVASHQLHATLDVAEVVKVVIEIVINLIGAQTFAVYAYDEKTGLLEAVASEGADLALFPSMALGEGVVGAAVAAGVTRSRGTSASQDLARPIAVIPLRVGERPVGAIAIFALLPQKDGFTPHDHDLFALLAAHAASALCAAQLYAQSERKLSTIQGFLDLLTK